MPGLPNPAVRTPRPVSVGSKNGSGDVSGSGSVDQDGTGLGTGSGFQILCKTIDRLGLGVKLCGSESAVQVENPSVLAEYGTLPVTEGDIRSLISITATTKRKRTTCILRTSGGTGCLTLCAQERRSLKAKTKAAKPQAAFFCQPGGPEPNLIAEQQ